MAPKIIHYCWFGGKPLPKNAQKCIHSWEKNLPDYEIKRWDESNFNVNIIPYVKEAYSVGKYAFVSDYARFWILYHYGGVYFDTDVEVLKPIDDIVQKGNFMGVEQQDENTITVAPGLGLAVEKKNILLKELMEIYHTSHFVLEDGTLCMKNIVEITTELLRGKGLKNTTDIQQCCGFTIYPKDYFCPIDYDTRKLKITANTRTIHHYAESWVPKSTRLKNSIGRILGVKILHALVNIKQKLKRITK
jgi:hypothetical protein